MDIFAQTMSHCADYIADYIPGGDFEYLKDRAVDIIYQFIINNSSIRTILRIPGTVDNIKIKSLLHLFNNANINKDPYFRFKLFIWYLWTSSEGIYVPINKFLRRNPDLWSTPFRVTEGKEAALLPVIDTLSSIAKRGRSVFVIVRLMIAILARISFYIIVHNGKTALVMDIVTR